VSRSAAGFSKTKKKKKLHTTIQKKKGKQDKVSEKRGNCERWDLGEGRGSAPGRERHGFRFIAIYNGGAGKNASSQDRDTKAGRRKKGTVNTRDETAESCRVS